MAYEITQSNSIKAESMELDVDEKIYIRSIFNKCDRNGNHFISKDELICTLHIEDVSPEAAEFVFERSDQDRNGGIDFQEFVAMLLLYQAIFQRYVRRYVRLFIVPRPTKGTCKITLVKRRSISYCYEKFVSFNISTLILVLLSMTQVILYLANCQEWLKFEHDKKKQLWRYFTFIFTHNDVEHLMINISIQFLAGIPLTMVHGWRVLVIYLAGVVTGCLFQSICYPLENLKGASPAVYALITAHMSKIFLNFSEVTQAVAQLVVITVFTVFDTVLNYFAYRNSGKTSYISHLGGGIAGLLVGTFILRNVNVFHFERILGATALILYVVMMIGLVGQELLQLLDIRKAYSEIRGVYQ
ncbi:rhomboid-related protein 2-like [Euwallacea similis]|uniref:rhomboid-related protein 2-like n=1 Tax=Euwallacea similis TaxID=1736056 RepID=UPI00344BC044